MFVNQDNSKSRPSTQYSEVIREIAQEGVCPFCSDNLRRYHKNPLVEKEFWWVTDNMYPYSPTKHHRLIIYKQHISHGSEIGKEAWVELQKILQEEISQRGIAGGAFVMRFGDTHYTGGTVSHLHAHILQSDPESSEYDLKKGLLMRIG